MPHIFFLPANLSLRYFYTQRGSRAIYLVNVCSAIDGMSLFFKKKKTPLKEFGHPDKDCQKISTEFRPACSRLRYSHADGRINLCVVTFIVDGIKRTR